jgi:L-alanine-DL-glutamate epimerase-like enolase superfamily enzyme
MAARLLGADALAIEAHWRWLYERCTPFGHPGAEMRALAAIDIALWDLLGQATGQPVYRLLGGPVRESIPVYNTCGGPSYGAIQETGPAHPGWPGYGSPGRPGELEDAWASLHAPGDLAEQLVAEGYHAVKLWPFDRAAHARGGLHISWADVEEGMRPLRAIRDRVGMKLDIAIEGHAFFQLPAALRIAEALREIRPLWVEDLLRVDCVATLADFRRQGGVPIAASEMLLGRKEYLQVLQAGAADYCMVDPSWNGGISESRRVIELAQAFNVPATIHDCTGPLTLFAGLHLAAASANVAFQETVRAHCRTLYRHLVDRGPVIEQGAARLPEGPGLGTRLHDSLFTPGHNGHRISRLGTA